MPNPDLSRPIHISVLNYQIVYALAVPGGRVICFVGEQVLQSACARNAAVGADDVALQMPSAACFDTAASVDGFDKLNRFESGFLPREYLSSHPSSGTLACDLTVGQERVEVLLTGVERAALNGICKSRRG